MSIVRSLPARLLDAGAVFGTLVLAGLKFAGYVDWSWWIVFSPILVAWVLAFFLLVALFVSFKRADDDEEEII